jgi:nucleotidyltransferase/DNA polymerase involved in DNA repair
MKQQHRISVLIGGEVAGHFSYDIDLADIGEDAQAQTLAMHADRLGEMVGSHVRQCVKDRAASELQTEIRQQAEIRQQSIAATTEVTNHGS